MIVTSPLAPADRIQALRAAGVEVLSLAADPQAPARPSLALLLQELGQRQMTHVLIEGGAGLLGTAIDGGLVDECHVFVAPRIIGGQAALSPVGGIGAERMQAVPTLSSLHVTTLGDNIYIQGDWPTTKST